MKFIKYYQIYILFILLIFTGNLYSQTDGFESKEQSNAKHATDYIVQNKKFEENNSNDSLKKKSLLGNLFVSREKFIYSDNPRYLIDGTLPNESTKIKLIPSLILGGVYAGVLYAQHVAQMNTIWKQQTNFRFLEDGRYALWADKAGHIFGCYFTSYLWSETLMLLGFSWDTSTLIGSILGFAYSTYVEILDGFGANWGFSPSDEIANFFGAGFFLAQHYIPYLQNFTPKFIYIPANWHGERRRHPSDMFIDDYSSHTIWMSVNMHNILPKSVKDYWPSWLDLSFGYAVRNLCAPNSPDGYQCDLNRAEKFYDKNGNLEVIGSPKFLIALDYDLVKLLPDDGPVWNWLRQSLNMFKLPSPTLEIGAVTRFYLMYPFPIKIGNVRF
ncbi:MAG: YfiM family protein [Bacteroidetes bacterium]|nr:YfiM family protein [Bacteroidota bacterium]